MALLCIISFHNEWNEDKWHIRLAQALVGHNLNCVKGFFSMCWTHFLSSCHILLCHAPFALISIHQQYRFTFHSTCIVFVCTSYTTMHTIERLNDVLTIYVFIEANESLPTIICYLVRLGWKFAAREAFKELLLWLSNCDMMDVFCIVCVALSGARGHVACFEHECDRKCNNYMVEHIFYSL